MRQSPALPHEPEERVFPSPVLRLALLLTPLSLSTSSLHDKPPGVRKCPGAFATPSPPRPQALVKGNLVPARDRGV